MFQNRKGDCHIKSARILNQFDRDSVFALLSENRKRIKQKDGLDVSYYHKEYAETMLSDDSNETLVGYFDEKDQLTSTLAISPWLASGWGPLASFTFFMTSVRKGRLFNFESNGHYKCLEKCVEIGELQKIYNFVFFTKKVKNPRLRKILRRKNLSQHLSLQRYDSTCIARVRAGI